MSIINRSLIEQTVAATTELLRFAQPADAALSAFFRAQRCGPRERAFIAETAYAVLRHKRSLTARIGPEASPRQLTLVCLISEGGLSQRTLENACRRAMSPGSANSRRGRNPSRWPTRPICPTGFTSASRRGCRRPNCWNWRARSTSPPRSTCA